MPGVEYVVPAGVKRRANVLLREQNCRHGAEQVDDEEKRTKVSGHRGLRSASLTAADKLHNLVTIAVFDERLRPLRPRQNFQVALDRHPPAVECKLAQQVRHASACLGTAGFAVNRYCDCGLQDSSRCGNLRLGAQLKM